MPSKSRTLNLLLVDIIICGEKFTSAVLSRFAMGAVNGMSGAIKRAAIDRVRSMQASSSTTTEDDTTNKNMQEEELIMSRILMCMSFGSAFAPAAGGWLASDYEDGSTSSMYPFLRPNIFGAFQCLLSAVLVYFFIQNNEDDEIMRVASKIATSNGESKPLLDSTKYGEKEKAQKPIKVLWKSTAVRSHVMAYVVFSFCIACVDEAMPLYLIGQDGGPGFSPAEIGIVLGAAGFIGALIHQTRIGEVLMEEIGLYKTLRLSSVLANIPLALVPISLLFKSDLASVAYIVLLCGVPYCCGYTYFGMIGIATSRTVPVAYKDDASRIMTWCALIGRTVGPTVAGLLFTFLPGDSWSVWIIIALGFGTTAAVWTYTLQPAAAVEWDTGGSEVARRRSTYLSKRRRSKVYNEAWGRGWVANTNHLTRLIRGKWSNAISKMVAVNRFIKPSPPVEESPDIRRSIETIRGNRRSTWSNRKLGPGIDVDELPFIILGTYKDDTKCHPHVLTPPLMEALHSHLPGAACDANYWLKYSLIRDGASLTALESKASLSQYTILAIETLEGDVFGCFMASPWVIRNRYEFSGQSFLWRTRKPRSSASTMSPDEQVENEEQIDIFKWSGENEMCQLFCHDKIAVGGGNSDNSKGVGFGFIIGDQVYRGSSSECKTYGNPILTTDSEGGGKFEVANLEVWALTPFLLEADAERSERASLFRKMNVEGQSPSSQSPWSQFL